MAAQRWYSKDDQSVCQKAACTSSHYSLCPSPIWPSNVTHILQWKLESTHDRISNMCVYFCGFACVQVAMTTSVKWLMRQSRWVTLLWWKTLVDIEVSPALISDQLCCFIICGSGEKCLFSDQHIAYNLCILLGRGCSSDIPPTDEDQSLLAKRPEACWGLGELWGLGVE